MFLVWVSPEEEQDSKPFKANFLNQHCYEASDEKNIDKLDLSFYYVFFMTDGLFPLNVSMRFQLHWGKKVNPLFTSIEPRFQHKKKKVALLKYIIMALKWMTNAIFNSEISRDDELELCLLHLLAMK